MGCANGKDGSQPSRQDIANSRIHNGRSSQKDLFPENSISFAKTCLTLERFNALLHIKDEFGFSLNDIIRSGIKVPEAEIGAYPTSADSYEKFKLLFGKIIQEKHSGAPKIEYVPSKDKSLVRYSTILQDNSDYLVCLKFSISRNLKKYPFCNVLQQPERDKIKNEILSECKKLEDDLKGSAVSLEGEDAPVDPKLEGLMRISQQLNNLSFRYNQTELTKAGFYNNWPQGRAIYMNEAQNLFIQINFFDHIRIVCFSREPGELWPVLGQLTRARSQLERKLQFAFSKEYGYLTSSIEIVGTGLVPAVHLKLPKLFSHPEKLRQIEQHYNLRFGEVDDARYSTFDQQILELKSVCTLGKSEEQQVEDLHEGVKAAIAEEKLLEQ